MKQPRCLRDKGLVSGGGRIQEKQVGITREGSATIRAIVFVFGLACLGACSAADKPSSEDDRGARCMLDSECAMGERCDASECVPVDDPSDAEPATEADLIEVLEESTNSGSRGHPR